MNQVEILTEDGDPPQWSKNLEKFALDVLRELNLNNVEIAILLCSKKRIQELNRSYRGKDYPTDVLSFSQLEEPIADGIREFDGEESFLGDIAISLDVVRKNAKEFNVTYEEEIRRVITHGILHLIGMEHNDSSETSEMIEIQERILKKLMEDKLF